MVTRKAGVALACALALTGAAAQAAEAGTLTIVSGKIIYSAAPGEFNDVTFEQGATQVRITDNGVATITRGSGAGSPTCNPVSGQPNVVACSRSGITAYQMSLGDNDDSGTILGTLPSTLNGGAGNDSLTGGSGPDTINLGTGDGFQQASGNGGVDTIDATQVVSGLIDGGPAGDTLKGSDVPSFATLSFPQVTLNGGDGNDTLLGEAGANALNGGNDNDTLTGGAGSDALDGGPGADKMTGGGGLDGVTYASRVNPVSVTIGDATANDDGEGCPPVGASCEGDNVAGDIEEALGGSNNDNLVGTAAPNLLGGNGGADKITGGAGDDTLCGDLSFFGTPGNGNSPFACGVFFAGPPPGGNDVLTGGAGNDVLDGGGGSDDLRGDDGTDAALFPRQNAVSVTLDDVVPAGAIGNDGEGCPPVGASCEGDNVRSTIENVAGGVGNDNLVGSAASNILAGGNGADTIKGGSGDDLLCGMSVGGSLTQPATNATVGSSLQFTFTGGPFCTSSNFISGSTPDGADNLQGGDGDDILDGDAAGDAISGGTGTDTVSYANKTPGGVRVTLDNTANDGLGCTVAAPATCENDNVGKPPGGTSTSVPDVENIVGSQGNDELIGGSATLASVLNGGPGNDRLQAGPGDDMMIGGAGADVFVGGTGFDYVDYRTALTQGFGATVTMGDGLANDGLACGSGQSPCEGDNVGGPPIGSSTAANDVEGFIGTPLNDDVTGNALANTLLGRAGGDSLRGAAGNDYISGDGSFDPLLSGGAGSDKLNLRDGITGETASCGEDPSATDADVATIDTGDTAGADCEQTQAGVAAVRMPRVADPRSGAFRALMRSARVTERLARHIPKRHRHRRHHS